MVWPVHESVVWNQPSRKFAVYSLKPYLELTGLQVYYMPTVLVQNVGIAPERALLIAGGVQIMFPLGNLLPALALDRMGRKPTMMIGCAICSFCMLMISVLLSVNTAKASTASVAFFYLYMLVFGYVVHGYLFAES